MDWTVILGAATGQAAALEQVVERPSSDRAALQTLLPLDEAPHPAAALVAAATVQEDLAAPIQAALAPYVAPALAAWRADPHWAERVVGDQARRNLPRGVARMVGALRDRPAAHHDAVAIVVRSGDSFAISRCLDALGVAGWRALEADRRAALLQKAPPAALGRVWSALDDAQRADATQQAASSARSAARLIGRIGAAAWDATDPALRRALIDAVARDPYWVHKTAPAWTGMTDDERDVLARAVIEQGDAPDAFALLEDLGVAGRAMLTADRRAALDARARENDAVRVRLLRVADGDGEALTDAERTAILAAAEREPWRVADLLRAIGATGWRALRADERERLAAIVRRTPDALFSCPPALWADLAGKNPPPANVLPKDIAEYWLDEDADADLGGLPPSHQAVVLALAPWRRKEAAPDSVRMQRLRAAWDQTPADERVALAIAHPLMLATVAAAARLHGGASAAVAAVGATVGRFAAATGGADAKRAVGAMLRTSDHWRGWMVAFAPTDGDPPEAWAAWRVAAQRGVIADLALCGRLAAKRRSQKRERPRTAPQRRRR